MWSIVDYSTMSNKEEEVHPREQTAEVSMWTNSWFGLFGTFDDDANLNFAL